MWLSIWLMVGWLLVVGTLAWLALRARLDVFTISLAALSVGVSGYLTWLVMRQAARVRRATNFAAAHRYSLPGDFDYGPSLFTDTYYCAASDAEAAGYRRR